MGFLLCLNGGGARGVVGFGLLDGWREMSGAVVDEDGDSCIRRVGSGRLSESSQSISVHDSALTVSDEEDDLFRHQDERESEKDVLLRHLRQSSREDAADMMLHSEVLHICRPAASQGFWCERGVPFEFHQTQVGESRRTNRSSPTGTPFDSQREA